VPSGPRLADYSADNLITKSTRRSSTANTTSTDAQSETAPVSGLIRSRNAIQAARGRGQHPSDGGSTGRSDTND